MRFFATAKARPDSGQDSIRTMIAANLLDRDAMPLLMILTKTGWRAHVEIQSPLFGNIRPFDLSGEWISY
jgi:hypothetical protein